ncbi:MAG: phosphate ABC transporter substrate-binding protein [Anaerolineae bacterium]
MRGSFPTAGLFVALLLLSLCGCGPSVAGSQPTPAPLPGTAMSPTAFPADGMHGTISIAGSTTVQPLAERLAAEFMAAHPQVRIAVQGGGSSTGVKSAGQGTVDIGTASRDIEPGEKEQFLELRVHEVARDGIAIVTHPDVGITGLTTDQVRALFSGEIRNWSELGGRDLAVVLVVREEGSGTRMAFEEMVMSKADLTITEDAILQPSNGAVRTTLASTPGSVGFLSLGYVDTSVRALSIDGVAPTAETASSGAYPIVRPLNLVTRGEPEGIAKAFLEFALSAAGQDIVSHEGYLPVR